MTAKISDLIGKTITAIQGVVQYEDEVIFTCSDGTRYKMHHYRECCESVCLEEIVGDPTDLIGTVLDARLEYGEYEKSHDYDSGTWSFYIIQTTKGAVTLRWLGTSNGYYSETVDFEELKDDY